MQTHSRVPLIGGTGHGQTVDVDHNVKEIELDIHTTGEPLGKPMYSETYERRSLKGEEFGQNFECFAAKSDDETESRELARWSIRQKEQDGGSPKKVALKLSAISDEIGRISIRISRDVKAGRLPDESDLQRLGELGAHLDELRPVA